MNWQTKTDAKIWFDNSGFESWDFSNTPRFEYAACIDWIYRYADNEFEGPATFFNYLDTIGVDTKMIRRDYAAAQIP